MMIHTILDALNRVGVYIIILWIPGTLLIINGIHVIRKKETTTIGRNSHFQWNNPSFLKGAEAVRDGKIRLNFGSFLLFLGIIAVIGSLL